MDNRKRKSTSPKPQKRRPLHNRPSDNKISDNIKNDEISSQSNSEYYDDRSTDLDNSDHNSSEERQSSCDNRKSQNVNVNSKKKNAYRNDYEFRYIVQLLVLTSVIIYIFYLTNVTQELKGIWYNQKKIKDNGIETVLETVKMNLKNIRSKFKNQEDDLWSAVFHGITNIIQNPTKPCIILLLGNQSDPLDCLAGLLGNVSSNALSTDMSLHTPENFDFDVGSVITSMRSIAQNHKSIIIWDLLNINVEALQAFHNLCDRSNPLVEDVIYIITIIADDYDKKSNALAFVEKKLFKKLSGKMNEDNIVPLVTRITDGPLLTINSEPSIIDCPFRKLLKTVKAY